MKKPQETNVEGIKHLNIPNEIWNELSTKEKELRLSVDDKIPDFMMDWNELALDSMADYLENKWKFLSSGEALCIMKMIDFYKDHKDDDKKQWYLVKSRSDVIGITTDKKLCKSKQSVFCGFEKINIIKK